MGKKLKVVLFLILFSLSMFLFLGLKKVRIKERVFDTEQKYYFFGAGSKGSFRPILGLHGPVILRLHQQMQESSYFSRSEALSKIKAI